MVEQIKFKQHLKIKFFLPPPRFYPPEYLLIKAQLDKPVEADKETTGAV